MSGHDDADDPQDGSSPPLPPDDRLWRHPSELGSYGYASSAPSSAPSMPPAPLATQGRTSSWSVLVAGLTGAVLTLGVIALTGRLTPEVVERHTVEKVAVTPVVSSPMVRGDRGVVAVAERMAPAIVRLDVDGPDGVALGSGVVFRDDGMLLTSAHLVREASSIRVRLADGARYVGELVGADPLTDVAVVHIDADDLPVAVLGTARSLEVGAPTVAIGCPQGQGAPSVTTGVISGVDHTVEGGDGPALHGMIQTDAPAAAGSPGGALLDTSGAVIGIVTAVASESGDRFGFATPIDRAHRVAMQLLTHGAARHGWLGIEGADLPADRAGAMGVPGGALVRDVDEDGPAGLAGLDEDDVITDIDGTPVHSMPGLVVEVREHEPGDEVTVGYLRDGQHHEVTTEIGERPVDDSDDPDGSTGSDQSDRDDAVDRRDRPDPAGE